MSSLHLPRRFYNQPQGAVRINWSNSITRGLVFAFDPKTNTSIPTGSPFHSGLSDTPIAGAASAPDRAAWPKGIGGTWASDRLTWFQGGTSTSDSGIVADRKITLLAIAAASQTASEGRVLGFGVSGGNSLFNVEHTTTWRFQVRNTAAVVTTLTGPSVSLNRPTVLVASINGMGGQMTLSADGGAEYTATAPTGTVNLYAATVGYLDRGTIEQMFSGIIGECYIWNRVLSSSERRSIAANPWQIFRVSE